MYASVLKWMLVTSVHTNFKTEFSCILASALFWAGQNVW